MICLDFVKESETNNRFFAIFQYTILAKGGRTWRETPCARILSGILAGRSTLFQVNRLLCAGFPAQTGRPESSIPAACLAIDDFRQLRDPSHPQYSSHLRRPSGSCGVLSATCSVAKRCVQNVPRVSESRGWGVKDLAHDVAHVRARGIGLETAAGISAWFMAATMAFITVTKIRQSTVDNALREAYPRCREYAHAPS